MNKNSLRLGTRLTHKLTGDTGTVCEFYFHEKVKFFNIKWDNYEDDVTAHHSTVNLKPANKLERILE